MTELTKLERLEKNVVETKAAYDAAIAYDAWSKARLELSDYLKEHGDEHSI
jgi:hypothetical protein